ncbi:MAG: ABC transporter permease [Clostridia bacterium]
MNKLNNFTKSIFAVLLGLLAGAILILFIGKNPLEGFYYLFRGGTMNMERIGNTIATATTLILTGLSVGFAFKTGLFNIGAAGQMLMGGLAATTVGLTVDLPKFLLLPLMLVAAMIGGGIWGSIPGFLKALFNVHEVVCTIMTNWIAYWIVFYTVPAYLKGQFLETESANIPFQASLRVEWLTSIFRGSFINLGIFVAVISVLVIKFILDKTTLGYELKAVGYNRHAAEYAGIKVNRDIVLSMTIAGILAGIGGFVFYAGYSSNIQIGVLPAQGFDGIAVALLGTNNPLGILAAALFFGLLHSGKGFMNAMIDVPPQIADTIIAIIIYFTAASLLIERVWNRIRAKRKDKKNGGA